MKRKSKFQPPDYVEHRLAGDVAEATGPRPVCAGCGKFHAKSRRPYLYAGYAELGESDVAAALRLVSARRAKYPNTYFPEVSFVTGQASSEGREGRRWVTAWGSARWAFEYGNFHTLRCAHAYAERMLAKYGRLEP